MDMSNMNDRRSGDRRSYDRRAEDRRKKRRFDWKYLIILAAVGGIVLLWIRINRQEEEAVQETAVPVRVVFPETGNIRRTLDLSGYVESESMVTVLPKISGSLMSLSVDMGDRVEAGEVIATLDSEPYELTLRQAEAALYAAESTYKRMEQLYSAQATSRQNYDQAKSQYDATKSQYELAVLNYRYTQIESPVSGVVLRKHTSVGSLVAPEVPLVTVGDLDSLIIKARVPEKHYAYFARNRENLTIEASLPALGGEIIPAKVDTVSPYISPETKTFETVCTLDSRDALLRPGMFINLSFILEERRDASYLPFETLVGGNALWWIDTQECRAREMEFEPGFHNNDIFQVPDEYSSRPFIIEGQHFIRDGQRCRVLNMDGLCGDRSE
jgi:RND family efflux transporter MFP subunit